MIFDASALLAYPKGEPGAALTESLLVDPGNSREAHAVNLCEVYYHVILVEDEVHAHNALADLRGLGLVERGDIDEPIWQQAARLKVEIQDASLADCFVIALAQRVGGNIVTADHPAFDVVAARGLCSVTSIR